MTPLRVAAGQAAAVAGDPAGNVATAVRLARAAADREVRLLLLPEAFLTGYDEAVFAAADLPTPSVLPDLLAPLCSAAREAGAYVLLSTPLRRDDATTMTMLVMHPDGTVSAPYDKQHLDGDEAAYFVPGDHGASLVVDGVELGLGICYDSSFPEHARHAADAGAAGYLASAAFFPGSAVRRDVALAARALDNGMYVVMAGAIGTAGRHTFIGGSAVYDPEGNPLARLDEEEGLAVADLDPAVVEQVRARRRMHADRRDDLGPRIRVGPDLRADRLAT